MKRTKENYFDLFIEGMKEHQPNIQHDTCANCGDPVFFYKGGPMAYWQHLKWHDGYQESYIITRCIEDSKVDWGLLPKATPFND